MRGPVPTTLGFPWRAHARTSQLLDRLGLLDQFFWLRARLGLRDLAVVTYHRVGYPKDAGELDPDLIEVEPDELAQQLDVIRAHCTIVSISDIRRLSRGKPLPPNPVMVTFDDGYRDNHDRALPILRRASVPATFFIPTAYPDSGRLFWWDRVFLYMRRSRATRLMLEYPTKVVVSPATSVRASARKICEAIKLTPNLLLSRLWEEIERKARVSIHADEEKLLAEQTVMGWKEVQALVSAGMDVQSHSHEHMVLNTLTPQAAQQDLVQSSRRLREALGQDAFGVAYPVGYEIAGDLRRAPQEARFELGFTNCTGTCRVDRFDPFNVPRISMDLDTLTAAFKMHLIFGTGSTTGFSASREAAVY